MNLKLILKSKLQLLLYFYAFLNLLRIPLTKPAQTLTARTYQKNLSRQFLFDNILSKLQSHRLYLLQLHNSFFDFLQSEYRNIVTASRIALSNQLHMKNITNSNSNETLPINSSLVIPIQVLPSLYQ